MMVDGQTAPAVWLLIREESMIKIEVQYGHLIQSHKQVKQTI